MKLSRIALIEAVKRELERREHEVNKWNENVDIAEEIARTEWEVQSRAAWTEYRDTLTKLLRRSTPFTTDDLPSMPPTFKFSRGKWSLHYSGKNYVWERGTHTFGKRPIINRKGLLGLIEFLDTVTDDTITFETIVRAGFKDGVQQSFGINTPS